MSKDKYEPPVSDVELGPIEVRLKKLNELFFPVELCEIRWPTEQADGLPRDFFSRKFFALTRAKSQVEAFQVVTRNYRLFPYRDGYDLAVDAFSVAFSQDRETVEPFRIFSTATFSRCQIDLHHPNRELEIELDGGDVWVPFVSIGNSYNKTQKVTIDLGVHLLDCESALLAAADAVSVEDAHSQSPDQIRKATLDKAQDWKFGARLSQFRQECNHAAGLYCKSDLAIPLALLALGLHYPHPTQTPIEQRSRWVEFHQQLQSVVGAHFNGGKLDPTVYTLLRALAVFLSAEKIPRVPPRSRRAALQKVGAWLHQIVEKTRGGGRVPDIASEGLEIHEMFQTWTNDPATMTGPIYGMELT